MLKIWKGPEMEGFYLGEITLFVCSDKKLNLDKLINILSDNNDISKVYLGGGRQQFKGFETKGDANAFISYCKTRNIKLTIETEVAYLNDLKDYLEYAEIIVTIRIEDFEIKNIHDIKLKLDDYKFVRIYDNWHYYTTDLSDVVDNKYSCDEMIYEED